MEPGVLQIKTPQILLPMLQPARYKGLHGGRGGMKSWFFAEAMIEAHLMGKTDSVCLREIQKSLQFSAHKLLGATIARLNAGSYFDVQDAVIKAKKGGIIVFQGMQDHTADSIKSLEGFDRAWFEEAQNASQRSLDLLRPTIRKPGSELWFSWNRFKEDDPIELLLCGDNTPDNAIVIEVNLDDNPWSPPELLAEREADRKLHDADKFANIWEGKYLKNTEGDYYKNEMAQVRAQGRILKIPTLNIPVNTFWDIGNGAGSAIWYHQQVGMEHRLVGYFEAHDENLAFYAKELQNRGYVYGKHYMPHDAAHKRLSDTNKSTKEMLEDLGIRNIEIIPPISDLYTGIQITRKNFPLFYFDAEACKHGIKRIDNYRRRYNKTDNRWIDEPNKTNGSSEAADALRQLAQAIEGGLLRGADTGSTRRRKPGNWRTL